MEPNHRFDLPLFRFANKLGTTMSEDLDRLKQALAETLTDEPRVVAAYLFGSQADGTAHSSSDVDVGVLFSEEVSLDELIRVANRLNSAVPPAVDLLDVKRARPFVALDIIRGDRFFCRDEIAADEFDLYVLRRAGDLEFFERERRAYYLELPTARGAN